jgi:uncharacterized protein (TIGR02145 family)
VYRWYKNLPGSFAGTKFKQNWWFAYQPATLLAYTDNSSCGDITAKTSSGTTARVQLLKWIQNAYTWTIVKDVWEIKRVLDLTINTSSPSQEVVNYAWNFVNNSLWGNVIEGTIIETPVSTVCTSWQWFNWTSCVTATVCADWLESITIWAWATLQTWACKNLWASTVWNWTDTPTNCGWFSTTNCNSWLTYLWNYYQWWRNEPVNTTTTVATYNWTFTWLLWHNNFVLWETTYRDWWQNEAWNTTPTRWTWTNPQWPCPTGWHIPSKNDWQLACNNILSTTCSNNMAYNSLIATKLRLPFAGYRNWYDGNYSNQSVEASYWSSTPNSTYAYFMFFNPSFIYPVSGNYRVYGYSVRCLKN